MERPFKLIKGKGLFNVQTLLFVLIISIVLLLIYIL
jgi:hypothetical protein